MFALLFASGMAALLCEAAWFRALTVLFGASLAAHGTVLAAFMLGMALGGEIGAWASDRLVQPLGGYAACEACVGVFAWFSPALFRVVTPIAAHASPLGRVVLSIALLLLPTVAMGATLPLAVTAIGEARGGVRGTLGRLYAINLLGGSVGTLLAGFALLPAWGVAATTHVASVAALTLAAVAWGTRAPNTRPAVERRLDSSVGFVALAAGLGALSFALQVTWNRAFALVLGSASYTFATVLAVVLAFTALGGVVGSVDDPRSIGGEIARRCIALAISVYLGTLVFFVAPSYLRASVVRELSMPWIRLALVASVVGFPSYQIGALFPALAPRLASGSVGRATGRAVFVTTIGNVAGALLASFVVIPSRGVQWTLTALSLCALALACSGALTDGWEHFRGTALASVVAIALGWAALPRWDPVGLSAGTFSLERVSRRENRGGVDLRSGHSVRSPHGFVLPRRTARRRGCLRTPRQLAVLALQHADQWKD